MTAVLNTSVGNDGHAVRASGARGLEDSGGLAATDGAHLLGGADGPRAHAHAQAVDASLDQAVGLPAGHNVAADNVELGELALEVTDCLELEERVALRRVHDDHVEATLGAQSTDALAVRVARADRAADEQATVGGKRGLSGRRAAGRCEQVRAGEQRHELALFVDDREGRAACGKERGARLFLAKALGNLVGGHIRGQNLRDGHRIVGQKLKVLGRDHAHEAAPKLAVLGHATERRIASCLDGRKRTARETIKWAPYQRRIEIPTGHAARRDLPLRTMAHGHPRPPTPKAATAFRARP